MSNVYMQDFSRFSSVDFYLQLRAFLVYPWQKKEYN